MVKSILTPEQELSMLRAGMEYGAEIRRLETKNLKAEIKTLRKALKTYGGHSKNCSRPRKSDCDCGWEEMKERMK